VTSRDQRYPVDAYRPVRAPVSAVIDSLTLLLASPLAIAAVPADAVGADDGRTVTAAANDATEGMVSGSTVSIGELQANTTAGGDWAYDGPNVTTTRTGKVSFATYSSQYQNFGAAVLNVDGVGTPANDTGGPPTGVPETVFDAIAGQDRTLQRSEVLTTVQGYLETKSVNGVTIDRSDVLAIVQAYITG